uniref:Glycosyl transferase family 1 domain-containing protein n=1 Tax=Kalanchoe fedtschenkoi TaxID=63787 RepID=A0A7N0SVT9_KALFE
MGRSSSSSPPDIEEHGDLGFHYRFPFRRNSKSNSANDRDRGRSLYSSPADRQWRTHHHHRPMRRKVWLRSGRSLLYCAIFLAVFAFVFASVVMQSSITSVFRAGTERKVTSVREGLTLGSSLKFEPSRALIRRFEERGGLDRLRREARIGVRPPRIALILGSSNKEPSSLGLFTVMKNLKELGYSFEIYAVEHGVAQSFWEKLGAPVHDLSPESNGLIDWLSFDGIVAATLEATEAISSLMQEPFCSVPLLWIMQEDTLANRLPVYKESGYFQLISHWKNALSRADVVVFSDPALLMLYSALDDGNFYVIPGSTIDAWAAESYCKINRKSHLRENHGFSEDDMLIMVIGSSFFYNELSWDYAVAMHVVGPLLMKYAKNENARELYKFLFVCGNSSETYDKALQEVASHLGLLPGSVKHYGMADDVNSLLLMSDVVLYGSPQDSQEFPPLLIRAMSFRIPIIVPDFPVTKRYIVDGVNGMIYTKHNPEDLMKAFSLLINDGKLSDLAQEVASAGKQMPKSILASECIAGYVRLFENLINFPSDVILPSSFSPGQQVGEWDWGIFSEEAEHRSFDLTSFGKHSTPIKRSSVVYAIEDYIRNHIGSEMGSQNKTDFVLENLPTKLDWKILSEIDSSEDYERQEMGELEERMEKSYGIWDDIYRNARKAEKLKFETNERDEGELERTGQPLCIYEIYGGSGAWPFLHHGSVYRGLSLTTSGRRLRSDDVNAVDRLPLLNDKYYRCVLCEIGGMFSIANKVDNIHKRPWIGFQSWHATAKKVSLSSRAEKALEETLQEGKKGDLIYFWARLNLNDGVVGNTDSPTFWSMCDILNGGQCRTVFENAFRKMYGLPSYIDALPPMPQDGGQWSALHSWLMPTPSFLEFVMFSRKSIVIVVLWRYLSMFGRIIALERWYT